MLTLRCHWLSAFFFSPPCSTLKQNVPEASEKSNQVPRAYSQMPLIICVLSSPPLQHAEGERAWSVWVKQSGASCLLSDAINYLRSFFPPPAARLRRECLECLRRTIRCLVLTLRCHSLSFFPPPAARLKRDCLERLRKAIKCLVLTLKSLHSSLIFNA